MSSATPAATVNHLLDAVPRTVLARLQSGLERVELTYGQVLYEPQARITHVYFPLDCLVSLLTVVDDRKPLEVGMVGNEGMVGMALVLGVDESGVRALVQGSGSALRMSAARFRAEFKASAPLQRAVYRYTHLLMAQVSQTAACNRFHTVDARLGRWLLMTADRMHTDQFQLTQEFLAHMLGVRRVGVTRAAVNLGRKKLIDYARGRISILNRPGLEAVACSCYRIVKDLQDRAHA